MPFTEIQPEKCICNPFQTIGKDWLLITAEKEGKVNTMTASWGGFGVMWGKNVAYIVIRPQRYTKEFIEASDGFSLTVFDETYRKTLSYLGTVSGREEDKIKNAALTIQYEQNIPYFNEANLVLLCKKLYAQDFLPENFIDQNSKNKWYPNHDYHCLYIAEIYKFLIKE